MFSQVDSQVEELAQNPNVLLTEMKQNSEIILSRPHFKSKLKMESNLGKIYSATTSLSEVLNAL